MADLLVQIIRWTIGPVLLIGGALASWLATAGTMGEPDPHPLLTRAMPYIMGCVAIIGIEIMVWL